MKVKSIVFSIFCVSFLTLSVLGQGKIQITSNSKESIALYKTGLKFEGKIRKAEAEASYKKALSIDPNFALAYLRLGMLHDNYDERRKYIAKAMKLLDQVSEGERLWILARNSFYGTGKSKDEYGYFEKLVKLFPNDPKANYLFGFVNIHHGQNNPLVAIKHYKKALELDPDSILIYNDLGYLYADEKDFVNAEIAFKKFIELLPNAADPYDSYAEFLMRTGQFEKSIEMYDKVLSIDPKYPWAYMGKATNLDFLSRNAEARKVLLTLDTLKLSDYQDRHKWRSKFGSFVHEGNIPAAIKVLHAQNSNAKKLNDFHQQFFSYLRMVRLYFEMGDPDRGLNEYSNWTQFVSQASDSAKTRVARLGPYYKAYAALLKGNDTSALRQIKQYEAGLKSPNDWSKRFRAKLLVKKSKYKAALDLLMTTNSKNAYNQYRIGEVHLALGQKQEAKRWFEKAAHHNTRNVLDYALVRKKALEKLTNKNSALKKKTIR